MVLHFVNPLYILSSKTSAGVLRPLTQYAKGPTRYRLGQSPPPYLLIASKNYQSDVVRYPPQPAKSKIIRTFKGIIFDHLNIFPCSELGVIKHAPSVDAMDRRLEMQRANSSLVSVLHAIGDSPSPNNLGVSQKIGRACSPDIT